MAEPSGADPVWQTDEQRRLHSLLMSCAEAFAAGCRAEPDRKYLHSDLVRRPALLYGVGLGQDESRAFLRALDADLVEVGPDGWFFVPAARACSPNLHLIGRNGDHVKLHTEVLIHVGAYAELVLDHGWAPERLIFDPFFSGAALDLWGYDGPPGAGDPQAGDIVFAAEAKTRQDGVDGLTALLRSLQLLAADPTHQPSHKGHLPKWRELVRLTARHPIELLLVANEARWWFTAQAAGGAVELIPR
ncbi:hypothetical protein ACTWPT_55185 [Nonomuraea sp. 3N208]|uniref:hypothetical protein n=1 Tax=Nonomuraea sp. 3N208 TaxID=3457421 RepID=UPI003FD5C5B7